MRKGLRGFVDDALSRTGPLAVEKSGDFPTVRPFAHKLHRALFVLYKIPEGQNQPHHRSVNHNWQGSTYQRTFSVQTNGATSDRNGVAHIGPLSQMHAVPGTDFILSGGGIDGQFSVWEGERRRKLATAFMGGTVTALALDTYRWRVYVLGEGGRVAAWPLSIAVAKAQLQAATSANLTPTERSDLLGEQTDEAYRRYSTLEREHKREPLPVDWRFKLPF